MQARIEAGGELLILLVEEDWRLRRFICTLLKYAISARVIEVPDACGALSRAAAIDRPVDLLIAGRALSGGRSGTELARELEKDNPSLQVLLMDSRYRPPPETPAPWRSLSIPFQTAAFLDCVNELCNVVSGCCE